MNTFQIKPGFGSHIPILLKALLLTKGKVVEFGMGYFSTPLLHMLCNYIGRPLVSYETLRGFYQTFKSFNCGMHKVKFVPDWETLEIGHCGLAFVDCKPAKARKELISRLSNKAIMIVVHDTQKTKRAMATYEYESIYPLFKYQYHCTKTNTSVLSNVVDVKTDFTLREPY